MNGKCPSCGSMVRPYLLNGPIGNQVSGPLVAGFIAVCPNFQCQTILGVLPDTDAIANAVVKKLTKSSR